MVRAQARPHNSRNAVVNGKHVSDSGARGLRSGCHELGCKHGGCNSKHDIHLTNLTERPNNVATTATTGKRNSLTKTTAQGCAIPSFTSKVFRASVSARRGHHTTNRTNRVTLTLLRGLYFRASTISPIRLLSIHHHTHCVRADRPPTLIGDDERLRCRQVNLPGLASPHI